MDDTRFDALTRRLHAAQTRRLTIGGGLAALTSLGLGSTIRDTAAKKKRKKKRKKKKSGAKTTMDAFCPGPGNSQISGAERFAQTFVALRSGKLTRAEFTLRVNMEGANFIVDIREVDAANVPDTVIATTTVSNLPATAGADPPRLVPVSFANPATVVVGLRYAISVTESPNVGFSLRTISGNPDPCPEGELFADLQADGNFTSTGVNMVFATFVTA